VAPPPPSTPDKKYFGTVALLAVISDKGYVCSTHILQSISKEIDKEIDKKTEKTVSEWHFKPASRAGSPVPVIVTIEVNYWTTSTGEIIGAPAAIYGAVGRDRQKDRVRSRLVRQPEANRFSSLMRICKTWAVPSSLMVCLGRQRASAAAILDSIVFNSNFSSVGPRWDSDRAVTG